MALIEDDYNVLLINFVTFILLNKCCQFLNCCNNDVSVLIFKLSDFNMEIISGLYAQPQFRGRVKVEAGADPAVSVKIRYPQEVLDEAFDFVRAYRKMLPAEKGANAE